MQLRDFKIGFRLLIQEPAYSAVVILGLSVGFAACVLLLGFVRYSWQYDSQVPDLENVYVIKQRYNIDPVAPWFDQVPYLLRAAALKTPGVVSATGYAPVAPLPVRVGARTAKLHAVPVLPEFSKMLGVKAIAGDLKTALERPENFSITAQAALRIFGTSQALGRSLLVDGKLLIVAAILRGPASNTTLPFEALVGTDSALVNPEWCSDMLTGKNFGWGRLLIRV